MDKQRDYSGRNGCVWDPTLLGTIELHLGTVSADRGALDLPARFGAQIIALAGDYSAARGWRTTRFVTLPATDAGAALAAKLVATYPGSKRHGTTMVIARPKGGADCPLVLVPVGREERVLARVLGYTLGAGYAARLRAYDAAEAERAARPGRLRVERAALLARVAEIDAELGETA